MLAPLVFGEKRGGGLLLLSRRSLPLCRSKGEPFGSRRRIVHVASGGGLLIVIFLCRFDVLKEPPPQYDELLTHFVRELKLLRVRVALVRMHHQGCLFKPFFDLLFRHWGVVLIDFDAAKCKAILPSEIVEKFDRDSFEGRRRSGVKVASAALFSVGIIAHNDDSRMMAKTIWRKYLCRRFYFGRVTLRCYNILKY